MNKEKGSRDFPCSVGNVLAVGVARVPSARVLRRHASSVDTCSPSARVLRRHVFSVGTCSLSTSVLALPSLSQHTHRPQPAPLVLLIHSPHVVASLSSPARVLLTHTRTLSAPPPSGASHPLSANRGGDTPPSLSFSRHRDRSFFTRTWRMH